jgi:integrase
MATIRKRGAKWQVQVRRKGGCPISRSFASKKDAQTWGREMDRRADLRELPADLKLLDQYTLGDLVRRYLNSVTPRKRGADYERVILSAFLRHPLCTRRLSELSGRLFAAYRDERLQEIKPPSLKRQLAPLSNLFEVARSEWGIPLRENPITKLKLPTNDRSRERRLAPGEYERLIEAADRSRNPLLLPIIQLALETGMRRGEILKVRWCDVSLQHRWLLIPDTKSGKSRTIPLTPGAVQIIAGHKAGIGISNEIEGCGDRSDLLFPTSANSVRLAWKRITKRARLSDLRFHDLRHEAISRFFEMGLTAPEVALISGHEGIRTLSRYSHPIRQFIDTKLRNAVQRSS